MNGRQKDVFVITATSVVEQVPIPIRNTDCGVDVTICSFLASADGFSEKENIIALDATSRYDIAAYWQLYQEITHRDPDIVHILPSTVGAIGCLIARLAGVHRIILTKGSNLNYETMGLLNRMPELLADIVVAESHTTQAKSSGWLNLLRRLTGTESTVIHSGVDIQSVRSYSSRNGFCLPEGFLIGVHGSCIDGDLLLRAVHELVDEQNEIQLVIIGDCPDRMSLEAFAHSLNIESNIHFLECVSDRNDILELFGKFDIAIFPSRVDILHAETMALGTPIVVDSTPYFRETVGDAGVFVDMNNVYEVQSAFDMLYRNPERRRNLANRGAKRIEDHFRLDKKEWKYASIYQNVDD